MKNILFLVKNIYNQGGDTRAITLLTNKLVDTSDYKITILSLFKSRENPTFRVSEKIEIHNLFESPFNIRKNYFKVMKAFNQFIKNRKIDVIFIEAVGFNVFTFFGLMKRKEIKTITVEHASYFDGGKKFGLAWFGRRIACKYNDVIVVLTKRDKMDYQKNMKYIKRIVQIYNPLDEKVISREYNYRSKKIISCGRLVQVKGFDMLIDIGKIVFEKHPDWEWHIYGEGPERVALEKKIKLLNLEKNIILIGEVDNVYDMYQDYSFYGMTSRAESFGMVLLEALKTGIPAVSFDCKNGPREILKDNVNGYLVEPYNIECFAAKICYLIENENVRIEFASNSSIKLEAFELNRIVNKWLGLVRSI